MEEQVIQAAGQYMHWLDHPSIIISSYALLLLTFIGLFWFVIKWVKEAIMEKIGVILETGITGREKIKIELKDNNASHERIILAIAEISEDLKIMNATYEKAFDIQERQVDKLDEWIKQLLENKNGEGS